MYYHHAFLFSTNIDFRLLIVYEEAWKRKWVVQDEIKILDYSCVLTFNVSLFLTFFFKLCHLSFSTVCWIKKAESTNSRLGLLLNQLSHDRKEHYVKWCSCSLQNPDTLAAYESRRSLVLEFHARKIEDQVG